MFIDKYLKATKEKDSFININLDPALPRQRKNNVISDKHVSNEDNETLLNFSLDITSFGKGGNNLLSFVRGTGIYIFPNLEIFLEIRKANGNWINSYFFDFRQ